MLLLAHEKAFVVFTVCYYASGCEHFMNVSVSVYVSVRETVHRPGDLKQITPDVCGVCVRRACLHMTFASYNPDLWPSMFLCCSVCV